MNVINFRNKDKIREQASEWITRLEDPAIQGDDIQELVTWLDSNPHHRTEFLELTSLWGNMDILSELAEMIPLDSQQTNRFKKTDTFDFRRYPGFAVIASVCAVLLLGIYVLNNNQWLGAVPEESDVDIVYTTPVGDQDSVRLVDGSSIKLNTDTRVQVDYTSNFRNIYLGRGEAYFDVVHDAKRPFVVHVGKGSVTAVGTAFNIKYNDKIVGVTVIEGIVEVNTLLANDVVTGVSGRQSMKKGIVTKTSVSAGQLVEFDEAIHFVDPVEPEEIDHKLAWQRGMLIFDGDYLEDAVNEITRYTDTEIVINDQAIRRVQIGGYFRTGEIDAMLRAFESSFGIAVTRVNDNLILLSKQQGFKIE